MKCNNINCKLHKKKRHLYKSEKRFRELEKSIRWLCRECNSILEIWTKEKCVECEKDTVQEKMVKINEFQFICLDCDKKRKGFKKDGFGKYHYVGFP